VAGFVKDFDYPGRQADGNGFGFVAESGHLFFLQKRKRRPDLFGRGIFPLLLGLCRKQPGKVSGEGP
jgi:hypothetical protein